MPKKMSVLDERGRVRDDATLDELADELRRLQISPEELLRSALEGEMALGNLTGSPRDESPQTLARRLHDLGIQRDPKTGRPVFRGIPPWKALRNLPHAIFSPRVAALVYYLMHRATPRRSKKRAAKNPIRGVTFEDTTWAVDALKTFGAALLPPDDGPWLWRLEKSPKGGTAAIEREIDAIAREIEGEAPWPAYPKAVALKAVAEKLGKKHRTLARQIERDRKPKKKP